MESSRAQLRLQLLASDTGLLDEQPVNTMSGFVADDRLQNSGAPQIINQSYNFQQPMSNQYMQHSQMAGPQNQNYSNHDLVTPVLESAGYSGGSSSRKASMNSSSMQRFFRRKGNLGGHFDEDTGADIGDYPSRDVSFNDITHLRGSGRYNTSANGNLDTAPIIPVLGLPGAGGAKSLNNVQYRKYMNHQKKINLAQSARAMSLASGGNPMANQDPRLMSFTNTNVPGSRTNSMGNPLNNQPNFRAMSLNSNAMLRGAPGQSPGPGGGPGFHPMHQRSFQGMNGQAFSPQQGGSGMARPANPYQQQQQQNLQMGGPGSPQFHQGNNHTMSLRTGSQQFARANQLGSRANSLNNNGASFNQGTQPFGPRSQLMMGAAGQASMNQRNNMGPGPFAPQNGYQNIPQAHFYGPDQTQYSPLSRTNAPPLTDASTDSLMNVLEEDEEEDKSKSTLQSETSQSSFKLSDSINRSLPPDSETTDEDHVYRFEDHGSPQISRKSTLKKSNSMRVRKLDLFSSPNKESLNHLESNENIVKSPGRKDDKPLSYRNSQDLCDIEDHDSKDESDLLDNDARWECDERAPLQESQKDLGSPQKAQPLKLKSLTHNTAFSKLRISSPPPPKQQDATPNGDISGIGSKSTETNNLSSSEVADRDYEDSMNRNLKDVSDLPSNASSYSAGTSKNIDTRPTGDSGAPSYSMDSLGERHGSSSSIEDNASLSRQEVPSLVDVSSSFAAPTAKKDSSLSRSNSELKMKGLEPSSVLLHASTVENAAQDRDEELEKREKRKSMSSISSRSRSFMKRLSFTNSRKTAGDDFEPEDQNVSKKRVSSSALLKSMKPLSFTKEELAIMKCNNELQSELQLITNELALSIKRELALEARLRSKSGAHDNVASGKPASNDDLEKSKIIADLQEKLNKERKLRFISEEHAILAEHGQSPSALKLNYEKNEIYNQLLAKNEMLIQLQDKLDEISATNSNIMGNDLITKFNELLKENSELKSRFENSDSGHTSISEPVKPGGISDPEIFNQESDQALIMSLRTQRDELRETITKLTSSRNVELKVAQDKIKTLEDKLEKMNSINHKLSKRADKLGHSGGPPRFSSGQGGKLQGFSIVSPSQKLFDE